MNAGDGEPLRGLIQDFVDMGVVLTKPGTFLTRDQYVHLLDARAAEKGICSVLSWTDVGRVFLLLASETTNRVGVHRVYVLVRPRVCHVCVRTVC